MLILDARVKLDRLNEAVAEAECELLASQMHSSCESCLDVKDNDLTALRERRQDALERRDYFLSLHPEAAQPEEIEPARDDPKRLNRVLALIDQGIIDQGI